MARTREGWDVNGELVIVTIEGKTKKNIDAVINLLFTKFTPIILKSDEELARIEEDIRTQSRN